MQLICEIYVNTDDNKLSITLLSLLAVISKFCPLHLPNDHLRVPRVSHLSDSQKEGALGTRLVSSYELCCRTRVSSAVSAELS